MALRPVLGPLRYLSRFVMDRSAVIRAIAYSADMAESYETPSIRINIVRPGFCALSAATRGGGTVAVDPDLGPFPLGSPVNLTATALAWLEVSRVGRGCKRHQPRDPTHHGSQQVR